MPRITPITGKAELPPEHHGIADAIMKVFGHIRGPFSMLLHSPRLAERVLPLVPFIREECIVEPKLRSVAILAAARERESPYVWAAQVAQARRSGLREEAIDLLRAKADVAKFSPEERDVINYSRQLMRTNRVEQSTFDALNGRYGAKWLVELTGVISYFAFVSGIANAFEVAPPTDGDKLPL